MKKFITDQSREMTAAVDMIGFIQIGDDGRSINTTSLNLLQIVAKNMKMLLYLIIMNLHVMTR